MEKKPEKIQPVTKVIESNVNKVYQNQKPTKPVETKIDYSIYKRGKDNQVSAPKIAPKENKPQSFSTSKYTRTKKETNIDTKPVIYTTK